MDVVLRCPVWGCPAVEVAGEVRTCAALDHPGDSHPLPPQWRGRGLRGHQQRRAGRGDKDTTARDGVTGTDVACFCNNAIGHATRHGVCNEVGRRECQRAEWKSAQTGKIPADF